MSSYNQYMSMLLQPQQSYQHPSIRKSYFEKSQVQQTKKKKNRERLIKKNTIGIRINNKQQHLCVFAIKNNNNILNVHSTKLAKQAKTKQDKIQELNKQKKQEILNPPPHKITKIGTFM